MREKIIIRMPNWLGDLVMATPVLKEIRSHWPEAHVTAMVLSPLAPLLEANPYLDEIFAFSRSEKAQAIQKLRKTGYDLGILLPNSFSSAWWFWRGKVKKRIGFATDRRRWLLTKPVPVPEQRGKEHLVTTYKRVLTFPPTDSLPELFVTEEERAIASEKFPFKGRIIGINATAAYGPAKCWLPDRFRAVTEKLLEDEQNTILYFGDSASRTSIQEICQNLPDRVVNLAGKTSLRELMALLERCQVFLTNDSGPMHLAAALKTPLVALFGSTHEIATGPYKQGVVIQKHVSCSPCYRRNCPTDFACMKNIQVDEVLSEIEKLSPKSSEVQQPRAAPCVG